MAFSVIFLGTSDFAVPCLRELIEEPEIKVKAVFTQPDRKSGRSKKFEYSPVKNLAIEENITLYQPEDINKRHFFEIIMYMRPDFLVVVSYGQILEEHIINLPNIASVNVHASLLPKYKGAAPIQNSLKNNDSETGVTVQKIAKKLDSGDILGLRKYKLDNYITADKLTKELSEIGASLLLEVLLHPLTPHPQADYGVSYCKKIKKEDGLIKWDKHTALEINCQRRAFTSWPGIHTFFNGKRLKILNSAVFEEQNRQETPGTVIEITENRYGVQCKSGILELIEVQMEGKKIMLARDFVQGQKMLIGGVLGGNFKF